MFSQEGRLQLALAAGRMGTWSYDLQSGEQVWDERQYGLFGLPVGTSISRQFFLELVLPEDRPQIELQNFDLGGGRHHDSEFRIRLPSGQIRWLTAHSVTRTDEAGQPIELVGVNWDITEQKLAEERLREAELRLELAADAANLGVWDWSIGSGEFFYSPRAREIYGFTPAEPIDFDKLKARTHPNDFEQVKPALARAMDPALRTRETYRYRITRADTGEQRWLLAHGGAVFANNKPVRYTGTLQDVTAEVETQRELEDGKARLELALEAADLAIWELDVITGEVNTSPALNLLYRFPPDAAPTLSQIQECYAPGELDRVQAESEAALANGTGVIRFEALHSWPDGVNKWIAVRARVIADTAGTPLRVIGVAMDNTDRRRSEEQLRVTARELQHRVKNTLAIVQSLAAQTFRGATDKEVGIATFGSRLHALAAATDLLTKDNWTDVSVPDLVEEVLAPFAAFSERIHLNGPPLRVPSSQAVSLAMALHELSTNAIKYGALSNHDGRVVLDWREDAGMAIITWTERDGPPVIQPAKPGFGTRLLARGLFDGNGNVVLHFEPAGVRCELIVQRKANRIDASLAAEAP